MAPATKGSYLRMKANPFQRKDFSGGEMITNALNLAG